MLYRNRDVEWSVMKNSFFLNDGFLLRRRSRYLLFIINIIGIVRIVDRYNREKKNTMTTKKRKKKNFY